MPKLITVILLLLIIPTSFSQLKSSNEIVAEGGAKIKVRADLATFTLTVEKRDTIETTAIMLLNKTVDKLINSLNSLGFRSDHIKIANYEISSSTDRDDDKKLYTVSNVLKVNFPIDNKLINAFYTEIQQAAIEDLDVDFETNLSDSLEKAVRLRLVKQAIEDAKVNATNIAQGLNLRIGKVKQVQKYGEMLINAPIEMVKFTPADRMEDFSIKYDTPFNKFQVEDVELEEKITVVYEIVN